MASSVPWRSCDLSPFSEVSWVGGSPSGQPRTGSCPLTAHHGGAWDAPAGTVWSQLPHGTLLSPAVAGRWAGLGVRTRAAHVGPVLQLELETGTDTKTRGGRAGAGSGRDLGAPAEAPQARKGHTDPQTPGRGRGAHRSPVGM